MTEETTKSRKIKLNKIHFKAPKLSIKLLILIPVLALLTAALYFGRSYIVAATVNNQPIFRFQVIRALEKASGSQALDSLITEDLIRQEAKKENVTVTQQDLDTELAKIENQVSSQGQTLDAALKANNMTRKDLMDRLTTQIMVTKMVSKNITVTDEEIKKYREDNAKYLPENYTDAQIKDDLTQQKLQTEYQTWVDKLRAKAKILYLVKY